MSWVILARILILSGMLLCIVQGHAPPYYTFILKEISITRLCLTKNIMTVNGSFPGPVLRVHRGDTVYVNVYNQGDYGVTLHWHGVRNLRNPWSDGPEYITQCAIPPGSNMTYEVIFSLEEGTLWWHAHSDWTRATVHGAIVVSSPFGIAQPFPKPDVEEIIILASWFKQDVNQMVDYSLQNGQDFNLSNAFSINGQLGDFYPCSNDGTEYITQCAIPPGSNMTYEVIFSLEEGTLWWHAHSDWTRATVHGAIVVSSPFGIAQPFPKPDEEEIIILGMQNYI
ncbi:hypothetical protein TEA_028566 [Camellia sinensis var. sinensis]|uniref:Plastocyanin-like domain-containing protein n=1 Tax=Camellia sinensis var. sinensis TaxID=542762 RepID=A0A4V3WQJ7_CAMSN|nr:hypothetical protein TEA_028566 [Camellia sinensis var. sinensis]